MMMGEYRRRHKKKEWRQGPRTAGFYSMVAVAACTHVTSHTTSSTRPTYKIKANIIKYVFLVYKQAVYLQCRIPGIRRSTTQYYFYSEPKSSN